MLTMWKAIDCKEVLHGKASLRYIASRTIYH